MKRLLVLSDPRTGSTFLCNLLNSLPMVDIADEILAARYLIKDDLKQYLDSEMEKLDGDIIGFKMVCSQLIERKISFSKLIGDFGPELVIVLWRKSVIEQYCSLKIANKTGVWWRRTIETASDTISLDDQGLYEYLEQLKKVWTGIGNEWPKNLTPIYVCYEDLIKEPIKQFKEIYSKIGFDVNQYKCSLNNEKWKPIPPEKRISNWEDISEMAKNLELNVKQILNTFIQNKHLAQ